MRLSFVEAVRRVESFALGYVGRLGHRQPNAANKLDVDFAFAAAADVAPTIALKMENDGGDDGGRECAVQNERVDEETFETEIVGIEKGRIGGDGHVIGCARGR